MIETSLLKEKWRVQKELSKKSGYNLKKYADLVDNIMKGIMSKYEVKKIISKSF